jgi:alpha-galactosidase
MLGDPRKLPPKVFAEYRTYADWLQLMENRYGIMMYRQDLPGFDEPKDGLWDGFQRINTDTKSGGIIGLFRHGSMETKRLVTIKYLDPKKNYTVKRMNGEIVISAIGAELETKGFEFKIDKLYDGELFEVGMQ